METGELLLKYSWSKRVSELCSNLYGVIVLNKCKIDGSILLGVITSIDYTRLKTEV